MYKERYSEADTAKVAQKLLALLTPSPSKATVVGLSGDLGAGKTTLVQALGKLLGVDETIQSPTFVVAKFYPTKHEQFSQLVHVDAYRIERESELAPLGWERILATPGTLIAVEWPERITGSIPDHAHRVTLTHDGDYRIITHD